MKNRLKNILAVLASVVTGGVCSWLFLHDDAGLRRKYADSSSSSAIANGETGKPGVDNNGGVSERPIDVSEQKKQKVADSLEKSPTIDAEQVAEDELTSLQRSILDQIQLALDNDDLAAVRRAIAKFSASPSAGGLGDNVPTELKEKAIEALGWFGKKGAMDLVAFVCDEDGGISDAAFDMLEEALNDPDMSDYDRAEFVKVIMAAVSNEDRIDTIMANLADMRNSVKADTIISILQNGTPKAIEKLLEDIGFYADDDIKTIEDVQQWKKDNPDDEDDDDLYGGEK